MYYFLLVGRPTEIPEKDVFVCESLYDEARREIKSFEGLKKIYCKDPDVHRDEVYFFKKPINIALVDAEGTIISSAPTKVVRTSTKIPSVFFIPFLTYLFLFFLNCFVFLYTLTEL